MVILGSVSSWLRGELRLPEKNIISHFLKHSPVAFPRIFGFAPPRPVYRPTPAHTSDAHASPLGPGAVLLHNNHRSPRDHARFFQNRTGDIEIDPKSIYVHISGPHPDRSPPELMKNHQKSRKSQLFRYFSKLSRHGSSRNVTERSTTRKIFIFFW